jgi:hypothetical protein
MGVSSRYWQIVKIDTAGRRQVREITPAKEFLTDLFPAIANNVDVEDTSIQSVLLPLSRNTYADRYFLAERLRFSPDFGELESRKKQSDNLDK